MWTLWVRYGDGGRWTGWVDAGGPFASEVAARDHGDDLAELGPDEPTEAVARPAGRVLAGRPGRNQRGWAMSARYETVGLGGVDAGRLVAAERDAMPRHDLPGYLVVMRAALARAEREWADGRENEAARHVLTAAAAGSACLARWGGGLAAGMRDLAELCRGNEAAGMWPTWHRWAAALGVDLEGVAVAGADGASMGRGPAGGEG